MPPTSYVIVLAHSSGPRSGSITDDGCLAGRVPRWSKITHGICAQMSAVSLSFHRASRIQSQRRHLNRFL